MQILTQNTLIIFVCVVNNFKASKTLKFVHMPLHSNNATKKRKRQSFEEERKREVGLH